MKIEYFPKVKKGFGIFSNPIITGASDMAKNPIVSATIDMAKNVLGAGKSIYDVAKTGKSDKEVIEDMKLDSVYRDLIELENLHKLKKGEGFKII
jgi:hypothetical protein